ncbi:MAG: c-type cytochrome biogenesis protein CcmI, partial [Zoogloeaceae bacterium]|nr:c-type cytochrome biogenesis protein CcmI [Zoogloeaceae bacterium]
MTAFLIAAVCLILIPVAFLFPVLLKRRNAPVQSPATLSNLHILREQLVDLERERAAGLLSEADFAEARDDLERRLIEENAPEAAPAAPTQGHPQNAPLAAALLALVLVVGGFSSYLLLGEPLALEAENRVQPAGHPASTMPTLEQITDMIGQLQAHLKDNPNDDAGWLNLARAYQAIGRSTEAIAAYEKIEARMNDDPDLLTDYAEVIALNAMPENPGDASPNAFRGKPRKLLLQALKLNPDHNKALFLAGAAAFEAGDKQEAARHWEKL